MADDLKLYPTPRKKYAYFLCLLLKIPLILVVLSATWKIFALLHLSPKSPYENFPTHNVQYHNKGIAVPCSPMQQHDTDYVEKYKKNTGKKIIKVFFLFTNTDILLQNMP